MATRFYDPLGVVSPCTVQFKVLFQKLCEAKLDWDEPMSGELLKKLEKLIDGLKMVQPIIIPRCCFSGIKEEVLSSTLQGFCDASNRAYAAVVYLRVGTKKTITMRFLASKTRVAPLRSQTIPRLELLSALLLAKLMTTVFQALKLEVPLGQLTCYTDSKVVFYWLTSVNREWKQFVQNRVNAIKKLIPVESWRHCPGRDNPADLPSMGMSPLQLFKELSWLGGPGWLYEHQSDKLKPQEMIIPRECLTEMKIIQGAHSMLSCEHDVYGPIIESERFSSFRKLLRVTAFTFKFIDLLKFKPRYHGEPVNPQLTAADLVNSQVYWVKASQKPLLDDEKFSTWKVQFGLFLDDDGIWRCRGQLGNADILQSTKYPILLNQSHHVTLLIVHECHEILKHGGVKETLTELCSRFWIIKGRNFVCKVLHRCVICRRLNGTPFVPPLPPPLPSFRVSEAPPFAYTGVDFAGPLYIRGSERSKV